MRRLLRGQPIGDEKPTQFLQRIRNLAGAQCNDVIIRYLFLEQLPENIRPILAINETPDLGNLAAQADRIFEVMRPQINAVRSSTTTSNIPQSVTGTSSTAASTHEQTRIELNELREVVQAFTREVRQSRSSGQRSSRRSRDHSFSPVRRSAGNNNYCYFHKKIGNEARNCKTPCSWTRQRSGN